MRRSLGLGWWPVLTLSALLIFAPGWAAAADRELEEPGSSEYAERAALRLAQATEANDPTAAASAHYQLGRHFHSVGLFSKAEMHAWLAAEQVDRDRAPELAVDIDLMRSAVLQRLGRGHEAADILFRSLEQIDQLGLIEAGVRARITLSTLQSQAGTPEAARETALLALGTAEAQQMTDWQARLLINLMRIELTMPERRDRLGEPWMTQVLQLDSEALTDETQISLLLARLFYARTSGQIEAARLLGERVTDQASRRGNAFLAGIAARETAQLYCDGANLDQARVRFENSVMLLEQTDNLGEQGFTLNRWSDCEATGGNFEKALELQRRGQALLAESRQRRQDELIVSASLAFNTKQTLRELERMASQKALLGASLAREQWRAGALVALSGLLLALLALVWLRQQRLHERQLSELRLARARVNLLAQTSHEIRNPAQGLTGLLESLSLSSPALAADAKFKAALGSSRLIAQLARDYLDLALSEQDRLAVDLEQACDLRLVLDHVRFLIEGLFPEARGRLEVLVENDLPQSFRTDAARLTQVLLNGLSNAFRHGGEGPVKLRASLDRKGPELRFDIMDQGPGFPHRDQRLFQAYWKGASADPQGVGLGLAVSAAIVKRLGGDIEVGNGHAGGAILTLRLPFRAATEQSSVPPDHSGSSVLGRRFPDLRVAIMDDDAFSLIGLRAMAEALACQVQTVSEDAPMADCLAGFDPHLVIIDQHLGHCSGDAIAKSIRRLDDEAGRPWRRIIIVSGSEATGRRPDSAYDEWLLKPLSVRSLADQLVQIDAGRN
ncbi:MAG: ATP-binding protein [Wenzhouxiangella sp.]